MRIPLGQNFLTNKSIAEQIVESAQITPDDIVIEIGPGSGILTEFILKKSPYRTIAVELDKRWTDFLRKKFESAKSLTIINADAIKLDYEDIISSSYDDKNTLKKNRAIFIGNLPYCSATKILLKIISGKLWKRAVFMFQKEVAERVASFFYQKHSNNNSELAPSRWNKNAGYISVIAAYYSREIKTVIPVIKPSEFNPQPEVDSSVLIFEPSPESERYRAESLEEKIFFETAGALFATRRKNILNALHMNLEKRILGTITTRSNKTQIFKDKKFINNLIKNAGLDSSKRAEELRQEDFKKLAEQIIRHLTS